LGKWALGKKAAAYDKARSRVDIQHGGAEDQQGDQQRQGNAGDGAAHGDVFSRQ
jgi:hypothetical protein